MPNATKPKPAANSRGTAVQAPPKVIRPNFERMPPELKLLKNWVLWRYLPPKSNGGKWRKVPFQPNGKTANTTDRSTWSRFEECCAAYAQDKFDGIGFVFDGYIGADGLCYCGVDFDACVHNGTEVHSLALKRIRRLNTYTERSVSGTGFHCIARAEPLDRIAKFDGVEVYDKARYFTFTGVAFGEIKAAPAEIRSLVDELRVKEAAAKEQSGRSGMSSTELTNPFKNTKPAQAFAALGGAPESLAEGIKTTQWFETLSTELKDEVVDYALGVIGKNTRLLELEADGGNNAEYYKLTMSVARSGAPNAEDIFVKHASSAKNADPDDALRQHFSRCRASQPSGNREITVGTLLLLAQQNWANFDQWKGEAPCVAATPSLDGFGGQIKKTLLQSSAEFVAGFVPPDYLIDGLMQKRYVYSLTAPTGAGKTCIALHIAMCVALGIKLAGMDVEKGRVLFFAGENPDDVRSRWIKLCEEMGQNPDDIDIVFMPGTPPISNPEIRQQINAEAKRYGSFSLLIVDTSAAYFQGDDENSNKQLGDHARMMRSFTDLPGGPSVLVTCHPTKNPDMSNLLPRGGGAFLAEVDGNLVAIKQPGSMIVELNTHGKFRGPEFSPISFKIVPGTSNKLVDTKGRLIWTVTAMPITEMERDGIDNSARAKHDALLVMMKNRPGLSLSEYAEALNWRNSKGDLNKRLVQTAMTAMTKDKLVEKKNDRYWPTNRGRKATVEAPPRRRGWCVQPTSFGTAPKGDRSSSRRSRTGKEQDMTRMLRVEADPGRS